MFFVIKMMIVTSFITAAALLLSTITVMAAFKSTSLPSSSTIKCPTMASTAVSSGDSLSSSSAEVVTVTGVIIVDHGSRKAEANNGLLEMVAKFRKVSSYPIIEAAHMELAEPSIRAAYEKCVQQGARLIICHPYFLSKGRHVQEDIPALLNEARTEFPGTDYIITEPIGMQEEVVDLISKSILSAVTHRAAS